MHPGEQDLLTFRAVTARLALVPVKPAHRAEIFREFTAEVTVYMSPRVPRDLGDVDQFIRESRENMAKGEEIVCAVLERGSGELAGMAGLHKVHTTAPQLGLWMKRSVHGRGYGREAMAALKAWADEHLAYEYIVYPVAAA
ncbi:MAG: GNAT family N-acetyltransferase, partial [Acidobacteriota bacterium]|nr:GNAT family N-acetyltransferase [Acidobacteriota bacterium]